MKPLIPNRLLFRFEFPLHHRSTLPDITGKLADWTDNDLLPALGELDAEEVFAPVWCCWNEHGLAIATRVTGRRSALKCNPQSFWKGDNLRLMIDTRDTRTIKRATRYCHHLYFLPCGGKDNRPVAGGAPVKRAKEDAPAFNPDRICIAASVSRTMYAMEAHIPSDCLNGFDPLQHPRIGLFYILEDVDLGQQALTAGDDLPWHVDPSLWATAVLEKP